LFKGGFPTRIDKLIKLLIVAVLVSMMTIELVLAAPSCIPVNGSITDSVSGYAISGAYIRNASNISATSTADSTDTTGTDGFFNLTCVFANEAPGATAVDYKFWLNASGYTEKVLAVNVSVVNGSYFGTTPGIVAAKMIPITPVQSVATASSIKRDSATISWTLTTPTDNVTNLYVGSRILYTASGIANITSSWTNLTLSPSISMTNLREGITYTAYFLTYNRASGSIYDSSSKTFTTLKSNMGAILAAEEGATTPAKPSSPLDVLTSPNKTPMQRNIIIGIIVAVVLIIGYFYFTAEPSKGKKRK